MAPVGGLLHADWQASRRRQGPNNQCEQGHLRRDIYLHTYLLSIPSAPLSLGIASIFIGAAQGGRLLLISSKASCRPGSQGGQTGIITPAHIAQPREFSGAGCGLKTRVHLGCQRWGVAMSTPAVQRHLP